VFLAVLVMVSRHDQRRDRDNEEREEAARELNRD